MEPRCRPAWKGLSVQHRAVSTATSLLPSPLPHTTRAPGPQVGPQLLEPQQRCRALPTTTQLQLGAEPASATPPGHVSRSHSLAAVDQELDTKQSAQQHVWYQDATVVPSLALHKWTSCKSPTGASIFHFTLFPIAFEDGLSAGRWRQFIPFV